MTPMRFHAFVLAGAAYAAGVVANAELTTSWHELPPVPDSQGLAGAVVGISKGALLFAGGSNFQAPVWENPKSWHDRMFVLPTPDAAWIEVGRLPRPFGYAATASVGDRVLCVGGEDGREVFSHAFAIAYDPAGQRIEIEDLPPLPVPLVNGAAAVLGDTLYIVGGQTGLDATTAIAHGYSLDLRSPQQWVSVPEIPGGPRVFSIAVATSSGVTPRLFVFGGRRVGTEVAGYDMLRDSWSFDPSGHVWRRGADAPHEIGAGEAVMLDDGRVLFLGYGDAMALRDVERLGITMREYDHPGFRRRALSYDTNTDTWHDAGPMPVNQVTTTAVPWHGGYVVPSGEIQPRVRTPRVWMVFVDDRRQSP